MSVASYTGPNPSPPAPSPQSVGAAVPKSNPLKELQQQYKEGKVTQAQLEHDHASKSTIEEIEGKKKDSVPTILGVPLNPFGVKSPTEDLGTSSVTGPEPNEIKHAVEHGPEELASGIAGDIVDWVKKPALEVLLYGVFILGGMALVIYGVATMLRPRPPALRELGKAAVKSAAVAAA